ncbi:MAG: hypothetical protein AABZ02_05910 [Bacteroidota bacterium]
MFALALLLFATFSGTYLLLRKLSQLALARGPQQWEVTVAGLLSWLFILSCAGWVLLTLFLLYDLLVRGTLGNMFILMFIGLASGLVFQFKEVLDVVTVWDFFKTALSFRPYAPQPLHFGEELDKKNIRDVYRKTSNKPFPTVRKEKPLLTEEEVARLRQEVPALADRPTQSARLKEELQQLKAGQTVDISDQWKIYTFERSSHDFYERISRLTIDPAPRTLSFRLDIQNATEHYLQDSVFVFQLKQDLYQLLQVLNTDPWLKPYSNFCDHIAATCYGIEADSFGLVQHYPFLHISVARKELFQREGEFFNAADLHKISSLTFNNGKPLQP